MKLSRYAEIRQPASAKAFADGATVAELIDMVNTADLPYESLLAVGRFFDPSLLNALSNSLDAISPSAKASAVNALGVLLANLNLDRAEAFASGLPTSALQAAAFAGILDQLRNSTNGAEAIGTLYAGLPESIKNSNDVRFAYGNAIWGADPTAALAALEGISDENQRKTALVYFAKNVASQAPAAAIMALYNSGLSQVGIVNHSSSILRNWAALDPQAAWLFLESTRTIPPADVQLYKEQIPLLRPPH